MMSSEQNSEGAIGGKYSKRIQSEESEESEESVHRVMESTVVDISIPSPSFKPLSLYLSWSPLF